MIFTYALTIVNQLFIMSILMAVGFVLSKRNIITAEGSAQISTLLLKVIMPCIIIGAFNKEYNNEDAIMLIESFVLVGIAYLVPVIIAKLVYKNESQKSLCLVLSNNGYMAIPLLQVLLGTTGVFLGAVHIVVGNLMVWTYGLKINGHKSGKSLWKQLVLNPGTLSLIVGLIVFVMPFKLPVQISEVVTYIGSINTPMAMILLGYYISKLNIKECLTNKSLIGLSALKLILIPVVLIAMFAVSPFGVVVCSAVLIGSATPTGLAAPMICQYCGKDYSFSTSAVTFTTILSILTMPVMLTIMQIFIK